MPKTKQPPTCGEFLVAAVRFFRKKRANIEGVPLAKVHAAALDLYPDDQHIRDALNAALKNETLWLAARLSEKTGGERTYRDVRISRLLQRHRIHERSWVLTPKGSPTDIEDGNHLHYYRIFLYVTADGLPKRLQKVVKAHPGTIGEQIIASIKKKT